LRSESTKLTDQGAVILGVVGDTRKAMAAYLEQNPLPFPMLIDEDRQVMKRFEVYNRLNWDAYRLAHPSAFLIDPKGQIRYSFVASNQKDWPRTQLLADELARLREAEREIVSEGEAAQE
jgi:peroxiredoxin